MPVSESDGLRAENAKLRQALRTIERRHDAQATEMMPDGVADEVVCCCLDCATIESALAETGGTR